MYINPMGMDALDMVMSEATRVVMQPSEESAPAESEDIPAEAIGTPVYAVERNEPGTDTWKLLSMWADYYDAKFEASRWEADSKIPHRIRTATLFFSPGAASRVWQRTAEEQKFQLVRAGKEIERLKLEVDAWARRHDALIAALANLGVKA